jgi:transposase-like protein
LGRRSKYPEEFRQRAAQLVLDSRRSVRNAAAELGVNQALPAVSLPAPTGLPPDRDS